MRHLKAGKRLGITTSHRKALMRNLVTSLLEHGQIKTTITKAKEMRKYFDKMIGLGKRNDLHARRQAMAFIKSKEAIRKLFEEYGTLYAERNGGYTRIFKTGYRLGDKAQMALIQMVDLNVEGEKEQEASKEAIAEIKEELQAGEKETQPSTEEESEVGASADSEESKIDKEEEVTETNDEISEETEKSAESETEENKETEEGSTESEQEESDPKVKDSD